MLRIDRSFEHHKKIIDEDKDNKVEAKCYLCINHDGMRIFIIHNFYQHAGGEDTVFRQEVEALKKHHTVKTLTFQNAKGWHGLLQYLSYPYHVQAIRRVKKQVNAFKPDIVHIHNTHYAAGPAMIRVLKKMNIPVVMTLHNFRLLCPSATLFYRDHLYVDSIQAEFPWGAVKNKVLDHSLPKTFLTAFTYYLHKKLGTWRSVDRFLTLSEFSRQLFLSSTQGLAPEQLTVKPNFVDIKPLPQVVREHYYLFVGRLSAEKGIMQLIEAIKGQHAIKLKIVGDGPLLAEIHNRIGNARHIELLGQKTKTETTRLLAACRALIVPSICYEGGVPLTIIEGMATCTPILATNIGAVPQLITPDETGWLFDPYQQESILSAITAFENSAKKDDIVNNAYTLYTQTFTKDVVMHQLVDIYKKIIKT